MASTVGWAESQGSKGAIGVAADTAKAVWDTISWNSDRGLLNASTTSLNPLGAKPWIFNPFHHLGKLGAGAGEVLAEGGGGTIGIISARTGNAAKAIIRGGTRMAVGGTMGDIDSHQDNESSKVDIFGSIGKGFRKVTG